MESKYPQCALTQFAPNLNFEALVWSIVLLKVSGLIPRDPRWYYCFLKPFGNSQCLPLIVPSMAQALFLGIVCRTLFVSTTLWRRQGWLHVVLTVSNGNLDQRPHGNHSSTVFVSTNNNNTNTSYNNTNGISNNNSTSNSNTTICNEEGLPPSSGTML